VHLLGTNGVYVMLTLVSFTKIIFWTLYLEKNC